MALLHQIVGVLANPLGIALFCVIAGLVLMKRLPKFGKGVAWGGVFLALLMGWMPVSDALAWWLEKDYPIMSAGNLPAADAIVVLGGGIEGVPEDSDYPHPRLRDGAGRVWHAARIWKCHPQLKIYCTCPDVSRSTPPFLRDLGVPADCIVPLDGPRNTEEEAKCIAKAMHEVEVRGGGGDDSRKIVVYLVTSAWHMKRAVKIFGKYAPNLAVVPAPIDHTLKVKHAWRYWVPCMEGFSRFNTVLHEYLGLVRYW